MLKQLELGNFKAFGDIQTIPIRPLTLLFGANSAGKSTILQSLAYLSEAFAQNDWNIRSTRIGGEFIDLGGLRNIVHQKDPERIIHFGLTISGFRIVSPFHLMQAGVDFEIDGLPDKLLGFRNKQSPYISVENLEKANIPYYECTFTFRFGIHPGEDRIHYFSVTEEEASLITWPEGELESEIVQPEGIVVSLQHEMEYDYELIEIDPFSRFMLKRVVFEDESLGYIYSLANVDDFDSIQHEAHREIMTCAVEWDIDQIIGFFLNEDFVSKYKSLATIVKKEILEVCTFLGKDISIDGIDYPIDNRHNFYELLKHIVHLGYFRPVPGRIIVDTAPLSSENGFPSVWDLILSESYLRESINELLGSPEYLDLGYRLYSKQWISDDLIDKRQQVIHTLEIEDLNRNVFVNIRELGQGVIQIIPILAHYLLPGTWMLSVEQPELHLHPGLQARLAKTLITLSSKTFRPMSSESHLSHFSVMRKFSQHLLIETHSEHFIKAIQLEVATNESITHDDVCILYIRNDTGNSQSIVREIKLDKSGSFTEPWPDDFFEMSADMTLERLRSSLKSRN